VQIQPGPLASITSGVSTPFLSTFTPIVHNPPVHQPFLQPTPPQKRGRPKGGKTNLPSACDSKSPVIRRPVGRPRGSGRKQREAAAQAAERAALGLAQTQATQK